MQSNMDGLAPPDSSVKILVANSGAFTDPSCALSPQSENYIGEGKIGAHDEKTVNYFSKPHLPNEKFSLQPSEVWKALSTWLHPSKEDSLFWWNVTGCALARMYLEAGYDLHSQYEALLFHYLLLVPALGPRPTTNGSPKSWKSFLTDDFSPLEYSWNWDSAPPKIRYSIEAIGSDAGTPADPFNQVMTTSFVEKLRFASQETDWEWFNYFSKALGASGFVSSTLGSTADIQSHPSSIFLGFEPRRGGVDIKAYFVPVKAFQTGQSPMAVVDESIKNLEKDTAAFKFPAYDRLISFIDTHPEGALLKPIGLAIDCVIPSKSRLKLYLRSPHTSFDSVATILTLNGTLDTFSSTAIADLRSLWELLLSLPKNYPTANELPKKLDHLHPTSGILYNFDIQPGSSLPQSKIYIPVKHYAESDLAVLRGLAHFLQSQKSGGCGSGYVENFSRMLKATWNHHSLESTCGVQTYISCTVKNGSLSLTSYLGAEIYRGRAWGAGK